MVSETTGRGAVRIVQLQTSVLLPAGAAGDVILESMASFSTPFHTAPLPKSISRLSDGKCVAINDVFLSVLGYERHEVVGRTVAELRLWAKQEERDRLVARLSAGEAVHDLECRLRAKSGEIKAFLISAEVIDLHGERCIVTLAHEDPERTGSEHASRTDAEVNRQLLQQLIQAQETERRRLAMDLHDGPLQSLGVSLLTLERIGKLLDRAGVDVARGELDFVHDTLKGAVAEVRALLADMSQEVLLKYGLALALSNYVDRFCYATGIEVRTQICAGAALPDDVALIMYRLAQEALANVRKHSRSPSASVTLEMEGDDLLLRITDNGIGFDFGAVLSDSKDGERLGLRSMQHRIQAAGGDLEIISAPGQGTTVTFRCPSR